MTGWDLINLGPVTTGVALPNPGVYVVALEVMSPTRRLLGDKGLGIRVF